MARWFVQLRQVVRRLGRAPMFTAITLLTLAVGVGANTVIFTVVENVLLKALPYPDPGRLIGVWYRAPGINFQGDLNIAPSHYFINREQNKTLEDIGVYNGDAFNVSGSGDPEHVPGLDVTDGTLPLLGVKPALGRLFTREDDTASAPKTVLLSYGYWQKKFGGATSVIGQSITMDGNARQIIGVLPRGFQFLDYDKVDLVVPMAWDRSKTHLGNYSYEALARLKPGVTMEQASADLDRLIPIAFHSFPPPEGFSEALFESVRLSSSVHALKKDVIGDIGNVLWVVMGALALVLLVACANVANLLLVRVEGRRQELAIRSALGASWGRTAGELVAESLVLGLLGSLIGLGLAYAGLRALIWAAPQGLPRLHEIHVDLYALLFTAGLALLTSFFIAILPIAKFAGLRATTGLREGGRALSQGRDRLRARKTLVVVQVAMALVLLLCSGLMIRTFLALTRVDPGFNAHQSLETFRFYVPDSQIPDAQAERVMRQFQEISNRLSALPGVTGVSISSTVPLSGSSNNDVLYAQDHEMSQGKIPPIRRFNMIGPGYLATMGTRIVAGREMTWDDTYNKLPVAMISENMAREWWGSAQAALGKKIRVASTDDWREVVGVAEDVHYDGVDKPAPTTVYWPILRANFEGQKLDVQRGVSFTIRSPQAGSQAFLHEIEQAVWQVNANNPLANPMTMDEMYRKSMARTSFTLVLLSAAGTMALLLGVIGIYGVISYTVAQRSREVGIRMALGAQRSGLVGLFVRQGIMLTLIGAATGLVVAFGVMRLLSSILFNVSPFDPLTYAAITVVLLLTASVACYLPSRRAASVNPVDALRAE
ncbi:ABC transporter permease [Occallatibacter riparius]|uniref:ABC transporter permease n=1 Tax=Occallatibacter riparius TaxID=1002689 RepID=A0A9J7BTA3_9BACT|nr:ABC transporter permease [Occallatibacter riparius]UWZ84978.1 ABC transporter permease [Occallatibacter riparius]